MKKVLVYPCGTEIGLEVYRSLCFSTHYELYGGSSSYDHGRFVYRNHIDGLPFIRDTSGPEEIERFNETMAVIAPEFAATSITRSKRKTYALLKDIIPVPEVYSSIDEVKKYPVFIKPDAGQGSVGARKIKSYDELRGVDFYDFVCIEYLPGREYTVDCFTNLKGKLVYARGRERRRIKNGISVNTVFDDSPLFGVYARKINEALAQKGGWFFQVKEAEDGTLKLLEVSSRIAGTSAITRCTGVNLPMMTVNLFDGHEIDDVIPNDYDIELDRALENVFAADVNYHTAYIDYDDTLVLHGLVNTAVIKFVFQCINKHIRLVLLSKHDGSLEADLKKYRLEGLFDTILHIERSDKKYEYIAENDAVFIDDSFQERRQVKEQCGIPVFDTHMIKCLMED